MSYRKRQILDLRARRQRKSSDIVARYPTLSRTGTFARKLLTFIVNGNVAAAPLGRCALVRFIQQNQHDHISLEKLAAYISEGRELAST
jgi:hypothetical protein